MEILKNVILAVHILGVVGLLGGVLYQIRPMREGKGRILPAMLHSAWTMLITGVALVGLQYPLGREPDNVKISVKLLVLIVILVIALVYRKRESVATWVLASIGALTVLNVLLATVWR